MSPYESLLKELFQECRSRKVLADHNALIERTRRSGQRFAKSFKEIDEVVGTMMKSYGVEMARREGEQKDEFRRRFADLNRLGNMAASLGLLSSTDAAKLDFKMADIGRRAKAAGL